MTIAHRLDDRGRRAHLGRNHGSRLGRFRAGSVDRGLRRGRIRGGHGGGAREPSSNPAAFPVNSRSRRRADREPTARARPRRTRVERDAEPMRREAVLVIEDEPRVGEEELVAARNQHGRRVIPAECAKGLVENLTAAGADEVRAEDDAPTATRGLARDRGVARRARRAPRARRSRRRGFEASRRCRPRCPSPSFSNVHAATRCVARTTVSRRYAPTTASASSRVYCASRGGIGPHAPFRRRSGTRGGRRRGRARRTRRPRRRRGCRSSPPAGRSARRSRRRGRGACA